MKKLITICSMLTLAGCAHFGTSQIDESITFKNGDSYRKITTKAKADTALASKSALAKWKASQTDKTQGAEVGNLTQEADGAPLIKAAVDAAVQAAVKAAKP